MKPFIKWNDKGYDANNGELSALGFHASTPLNALYLWCLAQTDIPDAIIDDKYRVIDCYFKRKERAKNKAP